jgi:hypothetical protein
MKSLFPLTILITILLPLSACAKEKWEYVSIGGDFTYAMRWNETYAAYIEEDLGVDVTLTDASFHSRKTLAEMLEQLQTDQEFRSLVENAEVVTISVPAEAYLGGAQGRYMSGMCGGEDGQQCFRDAHEKAKSELRAYLEELTGLANPSDTIVRTFEYGTVDAWMITLWNVELTEDQIEVFIEQARLLTETIREISAEFGIPIIDVAPIYQPNGLNSPPIEKYVGRIGITDEGVQAVADLLRQAGYAPLRP